MNDSLTNTSRNDDMKTVIWAYIILLVIEGGLRKWILPGLASPLLLVRDPLAIWLIFTAWNRGILPSNIYMTLLMSIGAFGILTTVFLGHGNLPVAIFGARPYLIHFPLIFIFGSILTRADVEKIGRAVLLASIPMVIIIALQFYSPQSAWVNRGVGGDVSGSGFSGALGFFRPSGTFSFTNGITLFFSLTSCFVFYFWLKPVSINKTVLVLSTMALMASIPFSISRGLFFSIGVVAVFVLFSVMINGKYLGKILLAVLVISVVIALLSQTSSFQTAISAFTARFENASASEGGLEGTLLDRYLGDLIKAFSFQDGIPVFGYGLGILSNVGTMLLSGSIVKGISEGDWGRGIYELGIILGMSIILIRLAFSFEMFLKAFRYLTAGDVLPWILMGVFLLNIPQGNWAQPTSLGFSAVIGGLLMASFNKEKNLQ